MRNRSQSFFVDLLFTGTALTVAAVLDSAERLIDMVNQTSGLGGEHKGHFPLHTHTINANNRESVKAGDPE